VQSTRYALAKPCRRLYAPTGKIAGVINPQSLASLTLAAPKENQFVKMVALITPGFVMLLLASRRV